MKLSDLRDDLGHSVSYSPRLAKKLGSRIEAILLSYLYFWQGKGEDPDWTYKTSKDITTETGLSRHEQEVARRGLRSKGLLQECKKGLPRKIYFHVVVEAVANFEKSTLLIDERCEDD